MADVLFVVLTLASFAALALLVGALDRADQRVSVPPRPTGPTRR